MIWIKRFSPLVIIALGWFGWSGYQSYRLEQRQAYDHKIATVTAHLFVASTKYRDSLALYTDYRDSLLAACSVSADEIENFPTRYGENVLVYRQFAATIDTLVDSLLTIEDSIWRANDTTSVLDSVAIAEKDAAIRIADSVRAVTAKPRMR